MNDPQAHPEQSDSEAIGCAFPFDRDPHFVLVPRSSLDRRGIMDGSRKASPRRANVRAHGTEGMTSMQAQRNARPTEQKWWAVTRRYTVEDVVYVQAESASQAKARAADGEYDDATMADTVGPTTHRKARLIGSKPREWWTAADYEAEGEV